MLVFKCPTGWCGKEASTLDAMALVQPDGYHCDVCDAVLEPLSTTHTSGGLSQDQRQALLDLQVCSFFPAAHSALQRLLMD